jgi:hypothetical protein
MPRPIEYEVNDLTVRLMDGGLPERSARREAERIRDSIRASTFNDAATIADGGGERSCDCGGCDECVTYRIADDLRRAARECST